MHKNLFAGRSYKKSARGGRSTTGGGNEKMKIVSLFDFGKV